MDKMREQFEAWFFGESGLSVNCENTSWQAWQASRIALVVELPVTVCRTHVFEIPYTNEAGMEHDEYFEVDDIHKALDAAGVAYK